MLHPMDQEAQVLLIILSMVTRLIHSDHRLVLILISNRMKADICKIQKEWKCLMLKDLSTLHQSHKKEYWSHKLIWGKIQIWINMIMTMKAKKEHMKKTWNNRKQQKMQCKTQDMNRTCKEPQATKTIMKINNLWEDWFSYKTPLKLKIDQVKMMITWVWTVTTNYRIY